MITHSILQCFSLHAVDVKKKKFKIERKKSIALTIEVILLLLIARALLSDSPRGSLSLFSKKMAS